MESPRRKHSRERALHPQEYLDTHHIPLYLNDVVTLLLRLRPAAPLDFIANYFAEVLNGTHVLLRDFAYISACPHNRWSFVLVIQDSFGRLSPNQELSAHDLLELLRLFCPDFPLELVVDACKLCGDGSGSHPLQDLLHAWRGQPTTPLQPALARTACTDVRTPPGAAQPASTTPSSSSAPRRSSRRATRATYPRSGASSPGRAARRLSCASRAVLCVGPGGARQPQRALPHAAPDAQQQC